jgi:hypothetical protein
MDDELKPIREKVAEIIQDFEHVPIVAENFIGLDTPKKVIEDKIDECNAYIGIFHQKWGFVPPSDNPKKLSISAIEFYRSKLNTIHTLVLISDKGKESDLEKFINKISDYENGIWRNTYKNFDELYNFVYIGIPLLIKYIEKPQPITNEIGINFESYLNDGTSELKDVSETEVINIINNLQQNIDENFSESQWIRLERIATDQRLWNFDEIWNQLNSQIVYYKNSLFTKRVIYILTKMIINSTKESDANVIYNMKKYHYHSYLARIFFDISINDDLKIVIRDLFLIIYDRKVRFLIYWKYWKVLLELNCDQEFTMRTQVFIEDFKKTSNNNNIQLKMN